MKNFVGQQGYECYHILCHVTSWSRDHKTRSRRFPIGDPLTSTLYLARFPRYWASNISGSQHWREVMPFFRKAPLAAAEGRRVRY